MRTPPVGHKHYSILPLQVTACFPNFTKYNVKEKETFQWLVKEILLYVQRRRKHLQRENGKLIGHTKNKKGRVTD